MENRSLICIGCPLGCPLSVLIDGSEISVTGHTCRRGEEYARKEVTNPTRILTSTIAVAGGTIPRVSVKTRQDIPKGKIFACMEAIKKTCVQAPVSIGDVMIKDCAGTGVDIIATKQVV